MSHSKATKVKVAKVAKAKGAKLAKTNAIREVEAAGLAHTCRTFEASATMTGAQIAAMLGLEPERVFKTLVTSGEATGQHYVFMVPVCCELNLKKAAAAVDEKAVHMLPARQLLPLTGYVHGGCSPIGMKKRFVTVADETAQLYDTIFFSGGRVGCQLELAPAALATLINLKFADLT
jgi:Cys-tRNA(Pro)/Cys-tRNA(Cys) deacylase